MEIIELPWPQGELLEKIKENLLLKWKLDFWDPEAAVCQILKIFRKQPKFQKNSNRHNIWLKKGLGVKFSGFASFMDTNQWLKFEEDFMMISRKLLVFWWFYGEPKITFAKITK